MLRFEIQIQESWMKLARRAYAGAGQHTKAIKELEHIKNKNLGMLERGVRLGGASGGKAPLGIRIKKVMSFNTRQSKLQGHVEDINTAQKRHGRQAKKLKDWSYKRYLRSKRTHKFGGEKNA